jgi:hypothetical protein
MALVNPNIAMGYRGVELANPLAQYGQVAAIQNAQNQNQLANMQMQEYSRAREEEQGIRNRLTGGASLEDPETRNFLLGSKTGREILQRQSDLQKSQTEEAARRAKLMADTEAMYRNMSGQISNKADAATFLQRMVNDPALKGSPIASIPIMQQIQRIPEDPQGLDNWVKQFALGTTKYITENKPVTQQINRMGQTDIVQIPGLGGTPSTVGTFADVPLPAAVEAQKARIAQAGKPITNITNVQEKAEAGAYGRFLVDQFTDISKAAGLAIKTLPGIEANLGALNTGLSTGFGTDAKKAGARVLGALGVQNAEKFAASAEMFQSNAINAVLQKQLEQKGPQTESDARRIEQVGAELAKTKDANEFILSLAKEQLKRDVDQRNFYDKWRKRTGSFDGAEDAWFSGEGGKSLFERPSLKKFAPGVTAGPSAVSQIPGQATAPARAPAAIPQAAIDALKSGRGTDAQFDAIFGPGAAKRARGQ